MAFTFKVKLKGSTKLAIWRRLVVSEDTSFHDLHLMIQTLFRWDNSHLFRFSPKAYCSFPVITDINGKDPYERFAPAKNFPQEETFDADDIKLSDYLTAPGESIVYRYDFGDSWEHIIELEEVDEQAVGCPEFTAGRVCNPIDDCGGVFGLRHLIDVTEDPTDPDYESMCAWCGLAEGASYTKLYAFNREWVNKLLEANFGMGSHGGKKGGTKS